MSRLRTGVERSQFGIGNPAHYPGLQREDLLACWAYASQMLGQEKVYPFQVA